MLWKPVNVLSIDFTVFQDVDIDTIKTCYPDGTSLSTNMSRFVWSSYYANPTTSDRLKAVKLNEALIESLKTKLKSCNNKSIPIVISTNHKDIYEFARNLAIENDTVIINMTHADMYHDMLNNNYDIDNGNWLKFLQDEFDVRTTWINNPVTKSIYNFNKPELNSLATDFNRVNFEDIDAIFICRNDSLLPPHLDTEFEKLIQFICDEFKNVKGEAAIKKPRSMLELIDNQTKLYENNLRKPYPSDDELLYMKHNPVPKDSPKE